MTGITYQSAGVSPDKAAKILSDFSQYLKTRPKDPNVLSGIGPYASCYSLKEIVQNYEDPILVTSCDGVGTKAKLAHDWGKIDTLGEDLVAMNVNDLLCIGAKPLQFLDYFACGKLEEAQLGALLRSVQKGCELAGCALVGGETAEMPGMYHGGEFDLAGFAVGVVDRKNILGPAKVKAGDVILAVESNGVHSNGYSLVRKLVDKTKILNDKTPFSNETWKEALLKPTIIYVPMFLDILKEVSALAHITGGGLFENLPRVLAAGTVAKIEKASWQFPPLFQWIQNVAEITEVEMLKTFNCGVGMIVILPEANVGKVQKHLESKSLKSWKIGKVESHSGSEPLVEWK